MSDKTDYETNLIKYLNLIKYEIKIVSIEKMEIKLQSSVPMVPMDDYIVAIYYLLVEMIEKNDCYLATKVSRVLWQLLGKFFQGIGSLISA